jgi:hypothetical protein
MKVVELILKTVEKIAKSRVILIGGESEKKNTVTIQYHRRRKNGLSLRININDHQYDN